MPIPIMPMSTPPPPGGSGVPQERPDYSSLDYNLLSGLVRNNKVAVEKKLSDSDASLLFRFWQEGRVRKANGVETVEVPERFSNSDVLRLKALGFVVGDDTKVVKFTERAKSVINTLVLSEENSFKATRVHKPYNEILAEQDPSNKTIRLALDKKKQ
jgi:hypothetical protein